MKPDTHSAIIHCELVEHMQHHHLLSAPFHILFSDVGGMEEGELTAINGGTNGEEVVAYGKTGKRKAEGGKGVWCVKSKIRYKVKLVYQHSYID